MSIVAPREVAVELGVQVGKRLAEDLQAFDPHLRRGKRVHPGDDADAVWRRSSHRWRTAVISAEDLRTGLKTTLCGSAPDGVEGLDDGLGVLIDLLEGLGAVEVLGAGDEPDFEVFEFVDVGHGFVRIVIVGL